jgi:protein-tyrosine-phosphatase
VHRQLRSLNPCRSDLESEGKGSFPGLFSRQSAQGEVHPLAIETLSHFDYSVEGLRSKSWDEFADPSAPQMDFVFTVCDNAAGEACPIWPGHPMTAHWGIEDPAAISDPVEQRTAFVTALRYLMNRISAFIALPVATLDRSSLKIRLNEIGQAEGANKPRDSAA